MYVRSRCSQVLDRGAKEFGAESGWEGKYKAYLDNIARTKQLYVFDFVAEGKILEEMCTTAAGPPPHISRSPAPPSSPAAPLAGAS